MSDDTSAKASAPTESSAKPRQGVKPEAPTTRPSVASLAPPPGGKRGKKTEPDRVEMADGRAQEILTQMATELKDDDGLATTWQDLVEKGKVMFRGKKMELADVARRIREKVKLPPDITTQQCRAMELELGNLLQVVSTELTMADYSRQMFAERKQDFLASAADRRKTKQVLEAELAMYNEEYRYVRGMWLSSDLNFKFWQSMHSMITETLSRIKQASITLATEAKVDAFMNQGAPEKTGERY